MSKMLFLCFFVFQSLLALPLIEQFEQVGYVEILDQEHESATFDSLYAYFDEFIEFLQKNPHWEQKLYCAKERFIRSKIEITTRLIFLVFMMSLQERAGIRSPFIIRFIFMNLFAFTTENSARFLRSPAF